MKTTLLLVFSILFCISIFAQTSADSVTVTFRSYLSSVTQVTVPGEFNGWSASASPMAYQSSLQAWTKTFSFKIHSTGRTLADSVYQYKFYQGGTWSSDPLNPEVNAADNNNSILRMTRLFWFEYYQFLSGSNITRMTQSLARANSDTVTSIILTYGVSLNSSLTTIDVTAGYDASTRIWDWTLGTSIPKANYIRLAAFNNHGDSSIYTRGGYVWYNRDMPSYVMHGVTLPGVASNDSTSFRLRVSNKDYVLLRVALVGQPVATATPIVMDHNTTDDSWWTNVYLDAGTYEYVYEIENGKQIYDPWGRYIGSNGTRFTVGAAGLTADNYSWNSTGYQRPPLNRLVIYEMNLMEFAGGYYGLSAAQTRWFHLRYLLPYLDSLGINAIELMPVNDFGNIGVSGFSWGYDGNSYFALEPTFGSPADFKQFVDSAHSRGIAVIMDMVFNHLNETSTLWQMQPDESLNPYFKLCSQQKYNEDNMCLFRDIDHWTPETQELIYTSLKMWVDEYRIDGFRYDYTQGIGWNAGDTTYGVLGWTNKIARDYHDSVYQIAEHLPESPALVYYSGLTGGWHGTYRENIMNEVIYQNTSLANYENYILGLGAYGTNDAPSTPGSYANRTEPVNDNVNHDEQSPFYEMIHYQHIDTLTALKRDRLYATFMFTSLGIPMLWEGCEFGAPRGSDGNRLDYRPVEWNYYKNVNGKTQFQYYHTLVMQRRYNPALYNGSLVTQYRYESDRVMVWGFNDPVSGAQVEVIANLTNATKTVYNVPWLAAGNWYDVFDQSIFNAGSTTLASFTIPPYTARVFSNKRDSDLGIGVRVNGLLASYPFNGDANDVSSNGNTGVVSGASLTADRFGTAQSAYHFNGTSEYIQVPHSGSFTFSTKMTVNLWANIEEGGSNNPRFFSKGATPDGMEFYTDGFGAQSKRIAFGGTIGGQAGLFGGYSPSLLSNQSWAMVTYTQDSATGKLYINGVLDTTFTNTNGTLPQTTNDLYFGKNSQAVTDYFNGSLDDINIYNRPLVQREIDSLFHIGGWGYGSITGTKYNDLNGDSDLTGDPTLSGWVIKLYQNCNLIARKVTDVNGYYHFDSLNSGSYTVEESLKTGWVQSYPLISSPNVITTPCGLNAGLRVYSVTITPSLNVTEMNFANSQLGSICGIKFRDDNANGRKDAGEPGLKDWSIMLSGPVSLFVTTDSLGNYCFTGIPPGVYSVTEFTQMNWIQTTPNYTAITMTSGALVDTINIGNFKLGTISGIKFNDFDGNGIQDAGDTALAGWSIYLEKIGQPSPFLTTITGVDGSFTFDSLTYGDYLLYEEKRSGWSQSTPVFDTISLVSNTDLANMDFGNVHSGLVDVNVIGKWNMVSLPLELPNYSKTAIYPTAVSQAFKYAGAYTFKDTLEIGAGYWLKFPSAEVIRFTGGELTEVTIPVTEGWNMIGSISTPLLATSIGSVPSGIVTSQFFGFNQGYTASDTINPGKAYWVKTNQPGALILSSTLLASAANKIKIEPSSELPPPPPGVVNDNNTIIPSEYSLDQNYPNPFNPSTVIRYQLSANSYVSLRIYNVLGEEVATLVDQMQDAGYRSVEWNAGQVPSGVYFYKLEATSSADAAKSFTEIRKMILLK